MTQHPKLSSKDISFSLAMVGDISLNGVLSAYHQKNWDRFRQIAPLFKSQSLVFANLEVPTVTDERNENKTNHLFSNPIATREVLQMLNISCVSLANNHIFDCKMSGLKETINLLDSIGVNHTGAGWLKEHTEPIIIKKGNIRIGFIAYVDKSTNPKTETFPELFINYFEVDRVISDIKKLKEEVDKIICSIHWGVDYSYYPTSEQVSIAHKLVDAGADIIMGHHPHTLQPYERYNNGIILYSLGGLTFGDFERNDKMYALYRKTKRGVIAKCNLNKMNFEFIATKELVGNYLKLDNRDYTKWSECKWKIFKLKESNSNYRLFVNFEEKVLYRIYEYFFGYYQNPIKRFFQFSNIIKFKKLVKHSKK